MVTSCYGLLEPWTTVLEIPTHGSHRPGKVMEFNPWLEKSLNFMLTWKNGILPGKVIENQRKSLKNFMYHVKVNLNMKTLMIIWLKVSFCHYIWDQTGDCLAELLVTLLQIAEPLVTLYELNPIKQYLQGKHQGSKLPAIVSDEHYILQGKNQLNIKQIFLQSTVQICMFGDAVQWPKPMYTIVVAFW